MNSHHLKHVLHSWKYELGKCHGVLGIVINTKGSAYRRTGSFMFFAEDGRQLGLLSGGCLESDLSIKARHALATNRSTMLRYDSNDEDDVSFQLGIGCGGVVDILLQPSTLSEVHQQLCEMTDALESGASIDIRLQYTNLLNDKTHNSKPTSSIQIVGSEYMNAIKYKKAGCYTKFKRTNEGDSETLEIKVMQAPNLLILGGGADAQPIERLAKNLGWEVTVCDPRPANARVEQFSTETNCYTLDFDQLDGQGWLQYVNACIIMSHSVKLDAQALKSMIDKPMHYLGLLGPEHRKRQVFTQAGISESKLNRVDGPAGLFLGGELPESIALSIVAACHQKIYDPAR